jgi:thiol reductant ABC exporter CydD subunit
VARASSMRRRLLEHAVRLGPAWLAGERAGELSLAATRGVESLGLYVGRYLPQVTLATVVPVGMLVWIGVTDWVSGLVLLGMVALLPVVMVLFGREATRRAARQWRSLSALSARYLETVQGLSTLRANNRIALGRREVAESTEGLLTTTMGTLRVAFLSALAMELLAGLGVGLVAMLLGLRLLHGNLEVGTALAVLLVSPEVFVPLRRAGAEFHASTEGQAAATRIWDVLDQPAGASDRPHRESSMVDSARSGTSTRPASVLPISFESVTVTYANRSSAALGPIDLTIQPDEHVAVAGASGAGKSTLIALLLGFVAPSSGRVLVCGVDLVDVDLDALRVRITWVPQHPRLLRGTLLDNLRLGRPSAQRSAVDDAIEMTGLDQVIARLPRGLDTRVGEGGLTLSPGERQRVTLARAVVRDAPLALLDEPTSHLPVDAVTELRKNLDSWFSRRTVVVAAHRIDLLRLDRRIVLGNPLVAHPDAAGGRDADAAGGRDAGQGLPMPKQLRSSGPGRTT